MWAAHTKAIIYTLENRQNPSHDLYFRWLEIGKMGDIVRCEGLGAISILDLVNILSEPKKNQAANQKSSNQNPESILPIKKPQRRKSLTEKIRHVCPKEGCKRTFCSQVALENHMSRHARKYTCDTCNKTFSEHAKVKPKIFSKNILSAASHTFRVVITRIIHADFELLTPKEARFHTFWPNRV